MGCGHMATSMWRVTTVFRVLLRGMRNVHCAFSSGWREKYEMYAMASLWYRWIRGLTTTWKDGGEGLFTVLEKVPQNIATRVHE